MDSDNFTFDVSLSLNGSTVKPDIGRLQYHKVNITYDEFLYYLRNGYTVCHVYTFNSRTFSNKTKTKDNFRYTYYIGIDVDGEEKPMYEYIGNLNIPPSFAYETYHNKLVDGYRFRLVYVFDKPISQDEYLPLYNSILKTSGISHLNDNCMHSYAQCMVGCSTGEMMDFKVIYSKGDFDINSDYINYTHTPSTDDFILERGFYYNLMSKKPSDFIEFYRDTYQIVQSSDLILSDDRTHYKFPSPYYEINRGWKWDSFIKKGEIVHFRREKRIRDGQKRRQRLFKWAVLKCRIKPDIAKEELVYNMIWERETFFDNSDKTLTNKCIIDICRRAMESDLVFEESKHPQFVVNKQYCIEHGLSPNQLKNIVRKQLNSEAIGSWYDCSKSVKDNLEYAKEYGIDIGKTALYEWCKENGVNTKGE